MRCRNPEAHRKDWRIVRWDRVTEFHCFECGISWEERTARGW